MHAHLAVVLRVLDEAGSELRKAAADVPKGAFALKPAPERWSAAELLEHLALAEANFVKWIEDGITAARAKGLGAEAREFTALPERIRTVLGDRVNRRNAPERVQPKGGKTEAEVWLAIGGIEDALRRVLADADGLALSEVIVEHPSLGPLNIYQWVELIAAHRRRHVAQLQEIAAAVTAM